MATLFTTRGFSLESVRVPPFSVSSAEFVALVVPAPFGGEWYKLLGILGGIDHRDEVILNANTVKDRTLITGGDIDDFVCLSVSDYLQARSIEKNDAVRLTSAISISLDEPICFLQWKSRIELDLSIAHLKGAELIVFTTSGLDVHGLYAIRTVINRSITQCSAISLISPIVFPICLDHQIFTRYITCSSIS